MFRCEIEGNDAGVIIIGEAVLRLRHSSLRNVVSEIPVGNAGLQMSKLDCQVCGSGGRAGLQAGHKALLREGSAG